jgi:hypothetical protein
MRDKRKNSVLENRHMFNKQIPTGKVSIFLQKTYQTRQQSKTFVGFKNYKKNSVAHT